MIFLYCLFLFLNDTISLTQIEILYTHSSKDNLNYHNHDSEDVRKLATKQTQNYTFKSPVLQNWNKFHQSIIYNDSTSAHSALNFLKTNYHEVDTNFVFNYYDVLYQVSILKKIDERVIDSFLNSLENKQTKRFAFYLFYFIFRNYNQTQILDKNYYKYFKTNLNLKKKLYGKYLNEDIQNFAPFFRSNGLLHLEKSFYESSFVDLEEYNLLLLKMSSHYFYKEIDQNRKLAKKYNEVITPEIQPYVSVYIDSISLNSRVQNIDETDKDNLIYLYNKSKIRKIYDKRPIDTLTLKKLIYEIKETSYSDEFLDLQLSFLSFIKSDSQIDTIYKQLKKRDMDKQNQIITNIFQNSFLPVSENFLDYFIFKAPKKTKYILNEYLDITKNRSIFFKKVLPSIKHDEKFLNLIRKKNQALSQLEDLESYVHIAEVYTDYLEFQTEIIDKIRHIKDDITIENIQSRLTNEDVVLFFLKGKFDTIFFEITKNSVKTFPMDYYNNYLNSVDKNKKFIVIDNFSILKNSFAQTFYEKHSEVPNVIYEYALSDIFYKNDESVPLETMSFYGVNTAFNYEGENYSKLFYLNKEIETSKSFFDTKVHLNDSVSTLNYSSDILHISSHFVQSKTHDFFNRIPVGVNNDSVQMLTTYEIFGKRITASLAVLNACETAKSDLKPGLDGHKQFGRTILDNGAKSLLITTKNVDDRVAAEFLKIFYQNVDDGYSFSEALQLTYAESIEKDIIPLDDLDLYQIYGLDLQKKTSRTYIYIILILILSAIFIRRFTKSKA